MSEVIQSYRDLRVWRLAMEIAERTYRLTKAYPREEAFGLTSQSRRAAVSIASNIAEGYGRGTRASYVQFLRIAQGSLKELETQVTLAERVELATPEQTAELLKLCDQQGRMFNRLIARLSGPKQPSEH